MRRTQRQRKEQFDFEFTYPNGRPAPGFVGGFRHNFDIAGLTRELYETPDNWHRLEELRGKFVGSVLENRLSAIKKHGPYYSTRPWDLEYSGFGKDRAVRMIFPADPGPIPTPVPPQVGEEHNTRVRRRGGLGTRIYSNGLLSLPHEISDAKRILVKADRRGNQVCFTLIPVEDSEFINFGYKPSKTARSLAANISFRQALKEMNLAVKDAAGEYDVRKQGENEYVFTIEGK